MTEWMDVFVGAFKSNEFIHACTYMYNEIMNDMMRSFICEINVL